MPSGRYLKLLARPFAAAALLTAAVLAPSEALAVRHQSAARSDAKRFGLDKAARPARRGPSVKSYAAFERFNRARGGGWKVRFDGRTGLPAALVEGAAAPHPGTPQQAADAFLRSQRDLLGIDPDALAVEKTVSGRGSRHVLYRQTYRGLPVEFARVKVHLDERGAVTGVHSRFEPDPGLDIVPSVSAAQAAEAVRRDAGAAPDSSGSLVIFPDELSGEARLAWKFSASGRSALWHYYIDARSGKVLFRYNTLRFWAVCNSQGHITGQVYDVDPSSTPLQARPFRHQNVYIVDASTSAVTYNEPDLGDGFYCSTKLGAMFTGLQGPYVNVSHFRGVSAHYDNGGGAWYTVNTPVSSPHPYPNSSTLTYPVNVLDPLGRTVAKSLPIFGNNFHVGTLVDATGYEGGSLVDDDELFILDPAGRKIGTFYGERSGFHGAAVAGSSYQLRLKTNDSGQSYGFDVAQSSYMVLPTPNVPGPSNDLTWSTSAIPSGLRGELSLFYHVNLMHDYFNDGPPAAGLYGPGYSPGVNSGRVADIDSRPVNAIAHMGPNLLDAFYHPENDTLNFGDTSMWGVSPSDDLTDDASVIHHEYTHYMLEKIFSIQNFGQAGAISEALADYFAASSLNNGSIGTWLMRPDPPLRELDCQDPGKTHSFDKCFRLCSGAACSEPCSGGYCNMAWQGEIHLDSQFLGQALWDIRRDQVNRLGASAGQACSDGLVFQSVLFFPESFDELLDAMKRVDASGAVAACGGAGLAQSSIVTRFAAHGLPPGSGSNELHTGFETALDVSTYAVVPGTIYPGGHSDFFTFAAGPGPVEIVLSPPVHGSPPDGYYYGYSLTLYDRQHKILGWAPDSFAYCDEYDCYSESPATTLRYNNPSGGQLFLQVSGGFGSGVNSLLPYSLTFDYERSGALAGSLVQAALDRDVIDFSVMVTTWPQMQDYRFAYAQLRDQAQGIIPNTRTDSPGAFLVWLSSHNALGQISGQVRLATAAFSGAPTAFSARFPSVGTIYLEVFGYNVVGSTVSLGLSNPINLTTDRSELRAFNNIFNPARGEKATIRYDVQGAGHLTIKLYTLNGRLVATLFDGDVPAGKGAVDWAGQNISGSRVASGIYIVHMAGPGISKSQKIVVVK
jgi:Zn-dependent metalloprotease